MTQFEENLVNEIPTTNGNIDQREGLMKLKKPERNRNRKKKKK